MQNIVQIVTNHSKRLDILEKSITPIDQIEVTRLKNTVEKLEDIIESMGYYIPRKVK